jgi:hypothetical protein
MQELLAGDGQVPVSADQLRPAQSRNPPHYRPSLIARTIPVIPVIPFIRLEKHLPPHPGIAPRRNVLHVGGGKS